MKQLLTLYLLLLMPLYPVIASQPHGPKAIAVAVELGDGSGALAFKPSALKFERGKYYKLVITNPSQEDHYFTSDAFVTHVFTRKVEVKDREGKTLVEVHGAVNDLELKPGTSVEWYFFPMTKGKNLRLYCHKEGHEEAGMIGTIDIVGDLK